MAKSDLTAINAKTISVNGTPIAGSAQAYGPYTTFDQLDADVVVALNGTVIQGQMTSALAYTNIDHLNVLSGLSLAETVKYGTASTPASNNATGPVGIGAGPIPLPGGGGTPTPTPGPTAVIQGIHWQSNARGADQFNAAVDTNQSNIDQVCLTKGRSDYRTIRANVFPFFTPENKISDNYLSPGNISSKIIASTLPSGGIVRNVPAPWGGTSILSATANNAPDAPQWGKGRSLHENFISEMNFAIELTRSQGFTTVPVMLSQGVEGDNGAIANGTITQTQLENAIEEAFLDIRARVIGGENMRIVMIGCLPERLQTLPALVVCDNARKAVAARMSNVIFIPGAIGYAHTDMVDTPHYNAAGTRVNGRLAGAALAGITLPSTITFINDVTAPEGTGTTTDIQVKAYRDNYGPALTATANVALGSLTADDFPGNIAPTTVTFNFAAGEGVATATITVNADSVAEANENLTLSLVAPAGYILGAKPSMQVFVTNDDAGGAPSYLSASFDAPDGTGLGSYTSESGHTFTGNGSGFVINSSEVYSTSSGAQLWQSNWTPPSKAYRVLAQFNVKSITASQAIRWRVVDATNFYWFANVNNSATWAAYKTVGGSVSSLGTVTQPSGGMPVGSMPNIEIIHDANDLLTIKVDGFTVFGPVTEATFTAPGFVGGRQSASLSATTGLHIMSISTAAIA